MISVMKLTHYFVLSHILHIGIDRCDLKIIIIHMMTGRFTSRWHSLSLAPRSVSATIAIMLRTYGQAASSLFRETVPRNLCEDFRA